MPDPDSDDSWTSDVLSKGDAEAVKRRAVDDPHYLTSRDCGGATPLLNAIQFDDPSIVRFLLDLGADPNVPVDDGYTCLITAVASEHPASVEIVSRLIAAGADVHTRGTNGWTPLHMASSRGYLEKARLLLDAGADVNRRKVIDGEETPLLEAAERGHPDLVALLLERGADPLMRDTINCRTPLESARHAAKGADPDVIAFLASDERRQSHRLLLDSIRAEALSQIDMPEEMREHLASLLGEVDCAEQYREAADECARRGNHLVAYF